MGSRAAWRCSLAELRGQARAGQRSGRGPKSCGPQLPRLALPALSLGLPQLHCHRPPREPALDWQRRGWRLRGGAGAEQLRGTRGQGHRGRRGAHVGARRASWEHWGHWMRRGRDRCEAGDQSPGAARQCGRGGGADRHNQKLQHAGCLRGPQPPLLRAQGSRQRGGSTRSIKRRAGGQPIHAQQQQGLGRVQGRALLLARGEVVGAACCGQGAHGRRAVVG